MMRLIAGFIMGVLFVVALVVSLASSRADHLPRSGKECQLIQVKWDSGWSEPMTKAQARQRTSHGTKHDSRFVPLDSTSWYEKHHSAGLIRCLVAQRFHGVSSSTAISTWTCESHLYPKAYNPVGPYLGIGQMSEGFFAHPVRMTKLGRADKQPGSVHWANGYSNIFAGLWQAIRKGWDPWSCHG
jgi:hypothetical protein